MTVLTFFERPITLLQAVFCILLALKVGNFADIGWLLVCLPLGVDGFLHAVKIQWDTTGDSEPS